MRMGACILPPRAHTPTPAAQSDPEQARLCFKGMEIADAAGLLGNLCDQHEHLIRDGEWRHILFHGSTPLSLAV